MDAIIIAGIAFGLPVAWYLGKALFIIGRGTVLVVGDWLGLWHAPIDPERLERNIKILKGRDRE
jgi:hypothetical protein